MSLSVMIPVRPPFGVVSKAASTLCCAITLAHSKMEQSSETVIGTLGRNFNTFLKEAVFFSFLEVVFDFFTTPEDGVLITGFSVPFLEGVAIVLVCIVKEDVSDMQS